MSKTIFKYGLSISQWQSINLPVNAEILKVDTQNNELYIWVLQDTVDANTEIRYFEVFGTGHFMGEQKNRKHIGTVLTYGGSYVWHVFEITY